MSSKTISLERGAYENLKRAKRPGESFSMVVRRLTAPPADPMHGLVGILSPAKGAEMADLLDRQRALDREQTMERYRRLGLL